MLARYLLERRECGVERPLSGISIYSIYRELIRRRTHLATAMTCLQIYNDLISSD